MSRRSGRVTVPPLAFWTGERIERASDGAYAQSSASEPVRIVGGSADFTGTFTAGREKDARAPAARQAPKDKPAARRRNTPAAAREPAPASGRGEKLKSLSQLGGAPKSPQRRAPQQQARESARADGGSRSTSVASPAKRVDDAAPTEPSTPVKTPVGVPQVARAESPADTEEATETEEEEEAEEEEAEEEEAAAVAGEVKSEGASAEHASAAPSAGASSSEHNNKSAYLRVISSRRWGRGWQCVPSPATRGRPRSLRHVADHATPHPTPPRGRHTVECAGMPSPRLLTTEELARLAPHLLAQAGSDGSSGGAAEGDMCVPPRKRKLEASDVP